MDHKEVSNKKEDHQNEYVNNLAEKRKHPNKKILKEPEKNIITPIDIKDYK